MTLQPTMPFWYLCPYWTSSSLPWGVHTYDNRVVRGLVGKLDVGDTPSSICWAVARASFEAARVIMQQQHTRTEQISMFWSECRFQRFLKQITSAPLSAAVPPGHIMIGDCEFIVLHEPCHQFSGRQSCYWISLVSARKNDVTVCWLPFSLTGSIVQNTLIQWLQVVEIFKKRREKKRVLQTSSRRSFRLGMFSFGAHLPDNFQYCWNDGQSSVLRQFSRTFTWLFTGITLSTWALALCLFTA